LDCCFLFFIVYRKNPIECFIDGYVVHGVVVVVVIVIVMIVIVKIFEIFEIFELVRLGMNVWGYCRLTSG
jgi:hypothetical protein